VAAFAVVTLFFAFQIPKLQLDNDVVHFVPEHHPAREAIARMEKSFSTGQVAIIIGLQAPGDTIFTAGSIRTIQSLSDRLAALPMAEKVTSLSTTSYISGGGGTLAVEPLVPADFSGKSEEVSRIKEHVQSWDMYSKALVSSDYRSAEVMLDIKVGASVTPGVDPKIAAYDDVKKTVADMGLEKAGWGVYVSGTPAMAAIMSSSMEHDLVVLIPLVILVVVVVLFLSFRRLGGILLPLSGVLISTIWSVGLMALVGKKLTIISTILPVMMIAVGSAYGIHIVSHYYDKAKQSRRGFGRADQLDIMAHTLSEVGQPVFLAAITTVAGFASLCLTNIMPIFDFGLFSSFGVAVAWLCSLTLVPALILIRGPGPEATQVTESAPGEDAELAVLERDRLSRTVARRFAAFSSKPKTVIALSVAVVAISIFGASRMVVDNNMISFFNDRTDIAKSDKFLRGEFSGTKVLSIVVSGKDKGAMNDPDALRAMDDIANYVAKDPAVGKVMSYTQIVKRMNQVLNADEPADKVRPQAAPVYVAAKAASDEEPAFGFSSDPQPAAKAAVAPEKKAAAQVKPEPMTEQDFMRTLNAAYSLASSENISARELVGLVGKATNYEGAAYYEIPTDPARYGKANKAELASLISNYLVLASSGTQGFSDDALEPRAARMSVILNTTGNLATQKVIDEALAYAKLRLPAGYTAEASGVALIEKSITDLIVSSQVLSVLSSLLLVFIILWVYYRSFAAGLIGTIPLAASVLVDFALMGFLHINLDISTAMVASISIGTGIDYTIHFMSGYHHIWNLPDGKDPAKATYRTLLTSGKAILLNAISVAAGFLVLILSSFNPLAYLGILIAVTMLVSSFVSLTVLPVIINSLRPKFLDQKLLF
jgi:predicted RND superfamily exporter protein